MENIGRVSNQNSRLVAILKVAGIYLITLLLLILIFSFNKSNPDNNSDLYLNHLEQVKKDTASLKQMLTIMDGIASLTKKHIQLDAANLAGSKVGEMEKTEAEISGLYRKLQEMETSESLRKQLAACDNIYAVLAENRVKLKEMVEDLLREREESSRNLQSSQDEAAQNRQTETEQLNSQLDINETSLNEAMANLREARQELRIKTELIENMKEKAKTVLEKVKEINKYLEKEKSDAGKLKNWKPVVDTVEKKASSLLSILET